MRPAAPADATASSRWGARVRLGMHLLLGVVTIALGVWVGLRWSMIAVGVDARITSTDPAEEGPDFKVLEFDGGRSFTIDDNLMERLGRTGPLPGRHLQTDFGSTVAKLDGGVVPLRWSSTASRTVAVLVGIVVVSVVRRRGRSPSSARCATASS